MPRFLSARTENVEMVRGDTNHGEKDYFRNAFGCNGGLRIDHFLLSPHLNVRLINAGVDRHVRGWKKQAIMLLFGLN